MKLEANLCILASAISIIKLPLDIFRFLYLSVLSFPTTTRATKTRNHQNCCRLYPHSLGSKWHFRLDSFLCFDDDVGLP